MMGIDELGVDEELEEFKRRLIFKSLKWRSDLRPICNMDWYMNRGLMPIYSSLPFIQYWWWMMREPRDKCYPLVYLHSDLEIIRWLFEKSSDTRGAYQSRVFIEIAELLAYLNMYGDREGALGIKVSLKTKLVQISKKGRALDSVLSAIGNLDVISGAKDFVARECSVVYSLEGIVAEERRKRRGR